MHRATQKRMRSLGKRNAINRTYLRSDAAEPVGNEASSSSRTTRPQGHYSGQVPNSLGRGSQPSNRTPLLPSVPARR
jgi:hypothetical protein